MLLKLRVMLWATWDNIPVPVVLSVLNTGEMAGMGQSGWLSLLLNEMNPSSP